MAKFVIFSTNIRTVDIADPITTMGRDIDNNLVINDNQLSRKHCLIEKDRENFKVVDLKSSNGTYVNGIRIKSKVLSFEDRVKIGNTVIYYPTPE